MILNNLRKYVRRCLGSKTTTTSQNTPIYNYKDLNGYVGSSSDGLAMYLNTSSANLLSTNITNLTYVQIQELTVANTINCFVVIGTGDSSVNEDDYTLGNMITEDLIFSTSNSQNTEDLKIVTTITNTGDTDILITEIGSIFRFYSASTIYLWNGSRAISMLITKTKLETPVTLYAGSSIAIEIDLFKDIININEVI